MDIGIAIPNGLANQPFHLERHVTDKITFEQPLRERIRIFLRLESLYQSILSNLQGTSACHSRQALNGILDLHNIFIRNDLKSEVMKELERQISVLSKLEQIPGVNIQKLTNTLDELDVLNDRIHAIDGQIGQELKQNELLSAIKQRTSIPGGCCDFDLPAYHFWLEQAHSKRQADLQSWLDHFEAVCESINLVLHLIRDSALPVSEVAVEGFFQLALDANQPCQLVRVSLPRSSPYFPEISGGKHRFNIRFMRFNLDQRPVATEETIQFDLACCII